MTRPGLRRLQRAIRRHGQPHLFHFCDPPPNHPQRLFHRRRHFRIQIVKEIFARHTHPQPLHPLMQPRNIIRHQHIDRTNVRRIVSRNLLQDHRRIRHASRQRPNMIQRRRQRNHSPRRHASIRRLQPDAPAQRRRLANRSCRVRPNRRISHPRRNRRRRSPRRPAGNPLRVPRIVHVPEVADQRTPAVSKLMQIILPHNHCARRPQPPHHLGIGRRNPILI